MVVPSTQSSFPSFEIQMQTPLWTGGVQGTPDAAYATGIMGSLRWWYEALVRGAGGEACDPSQHVCQYDREKKSDPHKPYGLCQACRLFGTTGWARRFRLIIEDHTQVNRLQANRTTIRLRQLKYTVTKSGTKQDKIPTWFFPESYFGRLGTIRLRVIPTGWDVNHLPFDPPLTQVIAGLLQFITTRAAIGARPQLGFGVALIVNEDSEQVGTQALYSHLSQIIGRGKTPNAQFPALTQMFFARVHPAIGASFYNPESTFILKYNLRRLFAADSTTRHNLMGEARGERKVRAKVMISLPYSEAGQKKADTIRLWGFVPEMPSGEMPTGMSMRDYVLGKICAHVQANYQLVEWREMNSPRDTMGSQSKPLDFLAALTGLPAAQGGHP